MSFHAHCPVCGSHRANGQTRRDGNTNPADRVADISCRRCGEYTIVEDVATEIANGPVDLHRRAIGSHSIHRMRRNAERPFIDADVWARIAANRTLPSPAVQGENLLLMLGDEDAPGSSYSLTTATPIEGRIGALDESAARFVAEALSKKGLIWLGKVTMDGKHVGDTLTLTFDGWERYEQLKVTRSNTRQGFMAMAYGNEVLSALFRDHLKPGVLRTGFELVRHDEAPRAGLIDSAMRVAIRTSRFVVADLSDHNLGAYWEAGFAEGLGKPVIYTCERSVWKAEGTHFDTAHHHTIPWDEGDPRHAVEDLVATIRATLFEEAVMVDPPD